MPLRRHSAFTLIELLVVVAIIGVLTALLAVGVQRARESARATRCRSNLRQIGVALHNYHDAHGTFPPGCVGMPADPVNIQGWGWGTLMLPFIEEQALYDALDPPEHALPVVLASAQLQPLLRTPIPLFRCASDIGRRLQSAHRTLSGFVMGNDVALAAAPARPAGVLGAGPLLACISGPPDGFLDGGSGTGGYGVRAATSNYVASFGDLWHTAASDWDSGDYRGNGAFGSNISRRLRDMTDGASHTFAVGERSWESFASIWAGTDGWNRCEREGIAMVMATAYYSINSSPEPYYLSCDPKGAAGFGSMHPGGANFLMVDGGVRFVGDDINFANDSDPRRLGVFQRLARRNDGTTSDEP